MARSIDWDKRIGRLKLRDLHVFSTVVQRGSMAQAALHLGITQPVVSEIMSDLEHSVGVRLLDRSSRGVEPTTSGNALLKRSTIVFDELKQAVRDIESLADPTTGELRIGCVDSIASTVLPPVIHRFLQQYPRVALHVHRMVASDVELLQLRRRSLDIVLARHLDPFTNEREDLNVEPLFDDCIALVCGKQNRWARRSKIELAELINEPWIFTPSESSNHSILAHAFRARGLEMPKPCLTTFSIELRTKLITAGPYITAFSRSIMRLSGDPSLKILPVELPAQSWPVTIITLKNRTLNPIAQRFIEHLRTFTGTMTEKSVKGGPSAGQPKEPASAEVR